MRLNYLAVVLPALLAATSTNAAEIINRDGNKIDLNGRVKAMHHMTSADSKNGDKTNARFGITGETQINSELSGFGKYELEFGGNKIDGDHSIATRLAFAGLKFGNYGSLDYGRNYGVMFDVTSYTDVLPEFGGDASQNDNFMSGRANNLVTYRNHDFFGLVNGLNLTVQYQGKNEGSNGENRGTNNRANNANDNGDGYGLALSYDLGWGVSASTAMFNSNRTVVQRNTGAVNNQAQGKRAEGYAAGLKYNENNVYIAGSYARTLNTTQFNANTENLTANKADHFETVAQYTFEDFGLTPSIAYIQTRGKQLNVGNTAANDKQNLTKYIDLGATYNFNSNLATFVDYKINLVKGNSFTAENKINTNNIVAVGMTYSF